MLVTQRRVRTKHCMYYCFVLKKRKKYYILEMLISIFFSQSMEGKYNYFF